MKTPFLTRRLPVSCAGVVLLSLALPATTCQAAALNPTMLGHWQGHYVTDVVAEGNHAYVAAYSSGFFVLDIRNPASPRAMGSLAIEARAIGVALAGSLAYVAAGSSGLQVVDVADPAAPKRMGFLRTSGAAKIAVAGNHAYLADWIGGFRVVDVTDPALPRQAGRLTTPKPAEFLAVEGQHAYVTLNESGLWVVDISNPAQPRRVGQLSTSDPGSSFFTEVRVSGQHAYVAEYGHFEVNGALHIVDVSNPGQPTRVAKVPYSNLERMAVANGLAYLGGAGRAFDVFDVTNPRNPVRVGASTSPPGLVGCLVASGGRLFHGGTHGVFILQPPTLPLPLAFVTPPRWEPGGFRVKVQGPAGGAFELQRMQDHGPWETWAEGVFGTSGELEFVDETAASSPSRLYRARQR